MGSGLGNITRREFFCVALGSAVALTASGGEEESPKEQRPSVLTIDDSLKKYYNEAISKFTLGDAKNANDGLEMILRIDKEFPSSADAYFIAANAFTVDKRKTISEQINGALQRYNTALQLDKNFIAAYVNHAVVRCTEVSPTKEEMAEKMENMSKGNFWEALNIPPYRLKALKEAIEDVDKAIALKPNFFSAHFNKGLFLDYAGRQKEAVEEFSKAIDISLQNQDWSKYCPIFTEERTREVITGGSPFSVISAFIKLEKDRYLTHKVGGDRLVVLGEELVYLQNQSEPLAFAYFLRGMSYAQPSMKKFKNAMEDFNKAISLNPNIPRFYQALAVVQYGTGKFADYNRTCQKLEALMGRLQNLINQLNKQ